MLFVTCFSAALFVIGLFTNFSVDVDEDRLWTPANGKPIQHSDWIDQSGFPDETRPLIMLFRANGGNVLGLGQTRRVFKALDGVRAVKSYDQACSESTYIDAEGQPTCEIEGITSF